LGATFERLLWWNDDWTAYLPPGPGLDTDLVVVLEELYTLEAWSAVDSLPNLGGYDEVQRARVLGLASPWAERLGWSGRAAAPSEQGQEQQPEQGPRPSP